IRAKHRMSRADLQEWDELKQEFEDLERHADGLELDAEIAKAARGGGNGRFRVDTSGSEHRPYDPDGNVRDRAMRAVDRAVSDGTLQARGAETVEKLVTTGPPSSQSWAAKWAAATGDPAYLRAFIKKVSDPEHGQDLWTAEESQAWRTATGV